MLYGRTVMDGRVNPMIGGEGVGCVVRYLWCIPPSEKAKLTIPERTKWKKEEEEDLRGVSR